MNVIHETELSPRRRRRRQQRREVILGAAMDVLATEGFDALTMQRLARELDCAAGALYRYFEGKDALVVELQARSIRAFAADLALQRDGWREHAPLDASVAALGQLLGAARFYLGLQQRDARRFRLVSLTLADPRTLLADDVAQAVVQPLAALLAEVSELFEAAQRCKALNAGDASRRTLGLLAALHGATLLSKLERLSPTPLAVRELGLEMAATLLRGWGAEASTLSRATRWLDKQAEAEPSDRSEEREQ